MGEFTVEYTVEYEYHCRWTRRRASDRSSHSCSWRAWERRSCRRGRRRSRRRMTRTRTRRPPQLPRSSPMSVRQIDPPPTPRRRLPPASHRRLPACAQARAAIEEQKSVASHWMRSCKQAACPDRKGRRLTQRTGMAPLESPPPNLGAGAGRRAEAGRRAGRAQHCPPLAPLLVHVGHVGAAGRRTG